MTNDSFYLLRTIQEAGHVEKPAHDNLTVCTILLTPSLLRNLKGHAKNFSGCEETLCQCGFKRVLGEEIILTAKCRIHQRKLSLMKGYAHDSIHPLHP